MSAYFNLHLASGGMVRHVVIAGDGDIYAALTVTDIDTGGEAVLFSGNPDFWLGLAAQAADTAKRLQERLEPPTLDADPFLSEVVAIIPEGA